MRKRLLKNQLRKLVVLGVFLASSALFANSAYIYAKAQLAQVLISNAWQQAQASGNAASAKPWRWADTYPVARLQVPTLDEDVIVLHSVSGEALSFGPGLVAESSAPGSGGDTVIAAHRDTHFTFLQYLETGDAISLETRAGKVIRYRVQDIKIVDSDEHSLTIDPAINRLQLVTCYPFDAVTGGSLRYLVTALAEGEIHDSQQAQWL